MIVCFIETFEISDCMLYTILKIAFSGNMNGSEKSHSHILIKIKAMKQLMCLDFKLHDTCLQRSLINHV